MTLFKTTTAAIEPRFPLALGLMLLTVTAVCAQPIATTNHNCQQQGNNHGDNDNQGDDKGCFGIYPPNSRPFGLSYGEWSARWWQWMQAIPLPVNPNFEGTPTDPAPTSVQDCAQGQEGLVWFLGGRFFISDPPPPTTQRNCIVPAGKSIFFPIANVIFGDGWNDCNGKGPNFDPTLPNCLDRYWKNYPANPSVHSWDDLANWVATFFDPAHLQVTIDGVALTGLSAYRAQAPKFDYFLPTDNIFKGLIPPAVRAKGLYGPAGSDGYWIMLKPLSNGEHTIHFKTGDGFQDITYHLTVGHTK
jgi:hypothetical protein